MKLTRGRPRLRVTGTDAAGNVRSWRDINAAASHFGRAVHTLRRYIQDGYPVDGWWLDYEPSNQLKLFEI